MYRVLRAQLNDRGVEVLETYVTGPLISRRLTTVLWEGEQLLRTLKQYDRIRSQINRERRETADASDTISRSNNIQPISQGDGVLNSLSFQGHIGREQAVLINEEEVSNQTYPTVSQMMTAQIRLISNSNQVQFQRNP